MALIAATVKILTDADIASGRVFGPKLPQAEHALMPRKAVSVRGSGGGAAAAHWMRTGSQRIDIKSYGPDPYQATRVDDAVAAVLQAWRQGTVTVTDPDLGPLTVKVGWFNHIGGSNELIDPDTDWPFTLSVWQVWGGRYTGGT